MTTNFKTRNRYSGSDLMRELRMQESGQHKIVSRISSAHFTFLLNLVGPKIKKENTFLRGAIPARERLALTLRFLATGHSYTSLEYLFRMSKQFYKFAKL
jgi:hypothetical protein